MKKRILVTGASSGIGRAIATHLLHRGHEVWGTSRHTARLESIKGLQPLPLDLADPASIRHAAATLVAAGGVDVLVNNAGTGWIGPLEYADDHILKEQFQVLLFGPLQLTRALMPTLRQRHGLVINITSLGARFPIPFLGPYSAAKSALSALTDLWQLELPRHDVAFVDLQPGDFRTAFNSTLHPETWNHDSLYGDRFAKTWDVIDKNLQTAPDPADVATAVDRWIDRPRHGRATAGGFVQAILGPLAARLLPRSAMLAILRAYYRLR
jgi:NAD(P)-dependent dehydrogenase (short-subunit alcohol dehydrogenase family)